MGGREVVEPPRPTLDEATRRYRYGGGSFVGVTTVLKAVGIVNYGAIPKSVLEQAAMRGKYAHEACQLDDLGTLDESALDPLLRPYLDAWRAFKEKLESRGGMILKDWIERPVVSVALGYAGTLDRVIHIDGEEVCADIKTSAAPRWAGIQTAAYNMARGVFCGKRMAVEIMKTGKFSIRYFEDEDDYKLWVSALAVYKFSQIANEKK
jgi:hypothetical protein